MKTIGLSGKSGTGKSYNAMELCGKMGIEGMIDDGLFICENRIIAGISAKNSPRKSGLSKRLFLRTKTTGNLLSKPLRK